MHPDEVLGSPRMFLGLAAIWNGLAFGAGIVLALNAVEFGFVLIICGPVGFLLICTQVALARRRLKNEVSADGQSRSATRGLEVGEGNMTRTWVGGQSVPTAAGRLTGTFPLAALDLRGNELTFRIRLNFVQRLFAVRPLTITPEDQAQIFLVKRLLGTGVGIRPSGQPAYYLWTMCGEEIISALAQAGFTLSEPERVRP